MVIARFKEGTDRAGATISFDGDLYTLQGHGTLGVHEVLGYDAAGQLDWESPAAREFILTVAAAPVAAEPGQREASSSDASAPAAQAAEAAGILVATFGSTTAWVGKKITCRHDVFTLEGHGPITPAAVMGYDRMGHLEWASDGMRAWVQGKVQPPQATDSQWSTTAKEFKAGVAGQARRVTGSLAARAARAAASSGATPAASSAPATASAPGASPTPAPWWRRKRVLAAVAGIVVVVIVTAAVAASIHAGNQRKAAELATVKRAVEQVVRPFQKLDSALGVGLNFEEYGTMVRDAQYALDSYHPTDELGQEVASHLTRAAAAYRVADTAWNDDIQDEFDSDASYWNAKCPSLNLPAGYTSADDVRQAAWVVGSEQVEKAEQLLGSGL